MKWVTWRSIALVVSLVGAFSLSQHWFRISGRTTEQAEYEFLRERFSSDVPPGCRLAHVSRAGLRVLEIPDFVAVGTSAASLSNPEDLGFSMHPDSCVFLVRTSICTSAEGRALCAAIEERSADRELVARTILPAIPSHDELVYDEPEVEVVIWRVDQQRESGQ